MAAHIVSATRLLPAVAEETHAIIVGVCNAVMIVDIAEFGIGPHLSSPHADRSVRVAADDPGTDVKVVDMLFDIEVTAQPGEVVPIAHLPMHVGPFRLARFVPDAASIIVGHQRVNRADCTIVQPLDRFAEAGIIAKAESRDD